MIRGFGPTASLLPISLCFLTTTVREEARYASEPRCSVDGAATF